MSYRTSMNSVNSLLKHPFYKRTLEEKIEIKRIGRPTPHLNITQTAKKSKDQAYKRHFNNKIYEEHDWICGCDVRNALFCFPCILLGNAGMWSKTGVRDLGHLKEYVKKHSENQKHLNNLLDFSALGSVNIAVQLSRAYHDSLQKHNEQVELNRYILSKVIDCIKFCGAFELALRGHEESNDSENPGIFLGLVDLVSSIDCAVRENMEKSKVSKYTSKLIQNELLECMLEVCQDIIKEEIAQAKFVAVMADESTDVSHQQQLAIVFRYELNGSVYERFWGFFQPNGQDAHEISKCILNELNSFFGTDPSKVIAQAYDGASVMSGSINGVQARVKEHYPHASYIHCYAHQLNLVMEKAASQNKSARIFFCSLSGFPAFFNRSPQRISALEEECASHIPSPSSTRWNFKSRTVNAIYENQEALLNCMKKLETSSQSDKTVQEARGLRFNLMDEDFLFWLEFFHRVMPHVEILYRQIQSRQIDSIKVKKAINAFNVAIQNIRESIETIPTKLGCEYSGKEKG